MLLGNLIGRRHAIGKSVPGSALKLRHPVVGRYGVARPLHGGCLLQAEQESSRRGKSPGGDQVGVLEKLVTAARRAGVDDPHVLDAMRRVPRAAFVPLDQVGLAYDDEPVRIHTAR